MKRRSYTAAVKLFVAELATRNGVCETARFVGISKGTISGWMSSRAQLEGQPHAKRACRYHVKKKVDLEEQQQDPRDVPNPDNISIGEIDEIENAFTKISFDKGDE